MKSQLLAAMSLASLLTSEHNSFALDVNECVDVSSDYERLRCFDEALSPKKAPITDDAILFCESLTVSKLRSPSSFKGIQSFVEKSSVIVEYDAQNGYGAIVRGVEICRFAFDGSNFVYLNNSFENGSHLDNRFKIYQEDTLLSKEEGRKLFEYENRPSEEETNDILAEICMSKFDVSFGITHSAIKDATGSVTIYLKTSDGKPFKTAQCIFSGSEMKSHGVIN